MAGSGPSPALVVIAEDLDQEAEAWLAQRCRVERCTVADQDFDKRLNEASGLVVRTYTRVDQALLDRAPNLRVVGRAGVGVDNIEVAACRARGVEVVHTPDANTRAVVELVTSFMLDAVRSWEPLAKALAPDQWRQVRSSAIAPRQLADLTLGILGLGRVGKAMARVGSAFDMRVLYHDVIEIPSGQRHGAEPIEVEDLFARSDVLSVHIDHRPSNRHFVSDHLLGRLSSRAVFINASRGLVVDGRVLAAWLGRNPESSAYLDVHDPEPIAPDSPLLGLANAVLTPHIGAATGTAHASMSRVVEDVWRVLSGESPSHPAPLEI